MTWKFDGLEWAWSRGGGSETHAGRPFIGQHEGLLFIVANPATAVFEFPTCQQWRPTLSPSVVLFLEKTWLLCDKSITLGPFHPARDRCPSSQRFTYSGYELAFPDLWAVVNTTHHPLDNFRLPTRNGIPYNIVSDRSGIWRALRTRTGGASNPDKRDFPKEMASTLDLSMSLASACQRESGAGLGGGRSGEESSRECSPSVRDIGTLGALQVVHPSGA